MADEHSNEPSWRVRRYVEDPDHPRRHVRWFIDWRESFNLTIEYNFLLRPGFGLGFEVRRGDDEHDLRLAVHAGRLASAWLNVLSPATRVLNCGPRGGRRTQYDKPSYGLRLFPFEGRWISASWGRRDLNLNSRHVFGKVRTETELVGEGSCAVPMPEGNYPATWRLERFTHKHVRWPGKLLDVFGVKSHESWDVDIPGGIPEQGKGENSWDCGIDGTFGVSIHKDERTPTIDEVVIEVASSCMRDRERHGGPHDLPSPMSVGEAEKWAASN